MILQWYDDLYILKGTVRNCIHSLFKLVFDCDKYEIICSRPFFSKSLFKFILIVNLHDFSLLVIYL